MEHYENLQHELEEREKQMKLTISDGAAEAKILHTQLTDLRRSFENLKADRSQKETNLLGEIAELKDGLHQQAIAINDFSPKVTDVKEDFRSETAALRQEIRCLETEMQERKKENESVKAEEQKHENKLPKQNIVLDSTVQEVEQQPIEQTHGGRLLENKVESLEKECSFFKESVLQLTNVVRELEQTRNYLAKDISKEKEKELFQQKLTSTETQMRLSEENYLMEKKNNEAIIKDYKSRVECLEKEVKNLRANLCSNKEEIHLVNELLEETRKRESDLEKHKLHLEKAALNSDEQRKNNARTIKELTEKVNDLTKQNKDLVRQHESNTEKVMIQFHEALEEKQRQQQIGRAHV